MLKRKVLILDLDGKVLSLNKNCELFFCFNKADIIGKKRIYNFIQSNFVIDFINKFDLFKLKNDSLINFYSRIVNSFGKAFDVRVFLKKSLKKNSIICCIYESDIENNKSKTNLLKFFNFIFRGKFTLGSIIPFIFSFFWSINRFDEYTYYSIFFLFIGLLFFHISANTFNDYFDWKSGRDLLNVEYVLSNTGGSRAIDFKIVSEKTMLILSILNFFIVLICGVFLILLRGFDIFFLGLFAAFCVYFYSAPPIHLASRYGLGELMHVVCLGPLITYGCIKTLIGSCEFTDVVIGLPFGLLITCCLLLNEVPDSKFDKISKKNNLVVVLGVDKVPYLLNFLMFSAFFFLFLLIVFLDLDKTYCFSFIILLYFLKYNKIFFKLTSRDFISNSCIIGFNIFLYFSLLLIFLTNFILLTKSYPW